MCRTCRGTCEISRPERKRTVAVVDRDFRGRRVGMKCYSEVTLPGGVDACPGCAQAAEEAYQAMGD